MDRRTIELCVSGQTYRVVSSADEAELHRLAGIVSGKLGEMPPERRTQFPQAMLLVAMSLAHDVECERLRREALERRTGEFLRRILGGIDAVLERCGDSGAASDK